MFWFALVFLVVLVILTIPVGHYNGDASCEASFLFFEERSEKQLLKQLLNGNPISKICCKTRYIAEFFVTLCLYSINKKKELWQRL